LPKQSYSDLVFSLGFIISCENITVQTSNKIVEMIINKIIKIGLELKTPSELITEIPAGTNKNPILFVNAVPTASTCSNFTIPVVSATNINTNPITDAGIGIGIKLSIICDINNMIDIVNTC